MDGKIDEESDDKLEISEDSELAPLRALNRALNKRIRVSTSTIELVRNDSNAIELVGIEGNPSATTLRYLKQSLSDLVEFPDKTPNLVPKSSEDQTGTVVSSEASSPGQDTTSHNSESSFNKKGSYYSIPSCTSSFDGIVDPEALKKAEEAIADLQTNGPVGIVELSSLSDAVGKPIRIWTSDNEVRKIGKTKTGEAVDAEYHEPVQGEKIGHWTLRGNQEPRDVEGQLNDCLFSVVADQTNNLAPELRAATISRMRKNVKSLANRIQKIAKLEKCDRISLMIGGARYTGIRPQDAARVIDKSQQGRCHPDGRQGHPRGHASYPQGTGPTDSAERYSYSGMKTAFLSREDQDAVAHLVLKTRAAERAMERLNDGQTNVAITVTPGELEPGALPEAVEFYQGSPEGPVKPFRDLVMVLRHHAGEKRNPDADVFVHTFYPRLVH